MIVAPITKTKSNEWYTPRAYIEAAREVMGGIDLDPASCALANETVRATRYFDEATNGLEQQWYGRVWLNPPFSKLNNKSALNAWIGKIIHEYEAGNVKQAVLLTMNNIETSWFAWLWKYPLCFADHEVKFANPAGGRKCHLFGTAFAYLGPNEDKFIRAFSQFGPVARRISPTL